MTAIKDKPVWERGWEKTDEGYKDDISEIMDKEDKIEEKPEDRTTEQQLPEAPASATVKIKSKNGFEWLFTIRDEKASVLSFKMEAMEKKWISQGFTPLAQNAQKGGKIEKEYVLGRVCPLDGGKLVKPQPGSKAPIKCENNRWNSATKQSYGCQYIEWPQPTIPERQVE